MNSDFNRLNAMTLRYFQKHYTILGEGLTRKVFALNNNLVVKVAKGNEGYYQNFVENYVYTHCTPQEKKYLCPIIYYNQNIIIMLRAIPYFNFSKKKFINFSLLRDEVTAEEDILCLGKKYMLYIDDLYSPSSWGLIDDNYYLIDYGCTSYKGDNFYTPLVNFIYK